MDHTSTNIISLPRHLVIEINELFSNKTEKNHALRFIKYLLNKSNQEYSNIHSQIEVPNKYFLKVYGGRFISWLSKLTESNIIYTNHNYSIINNICKSYSININKYNNTPIYSYQNMLTDYGTMSYSVKYKDVDKEYFDIKKMVSEDFKQLKIDYSTLLEITRKQVEKININNFRINEQVDRDTVEVFFKSGNNEKSYWMNAEKAIEKAKTLRCSLIEDDKRYYIMDEFEFILMKKSSLYSSYKNSIDNLERKFYFSNRNSTNRRLDTNFTNMSNELTDDIFKRNNLVKLDLANAQFAILSDLFTDKLSTPDFNTFKKEAVSGTLYEYILDKMNIKDRKSAKRLVFELLFSKETNSTRDKDRLKEIFPSVVELIDEYKSKNGYKNFSVMLQKRESEIFIDGIWKALKKENYFCITKHDCLVVREKDKEYVLDFISNYFKKIDFKGKIVQE